MHQQIIDKNTGHWLLGDGITISNQTSVNDLITYFGAEKVKESPYIHKCYTIPEMQIGDLYFLFWFFFENEQLKKIGFCAGYQPVNRPAWSNSPEDRDFETNWIAGQMGDTSGFVWDMKIAGRNYHLSFPWGNIGVYYDFKNGTFDSSLTYL